MTQLPQIVTATDPYQRAVKKLLELGHELGTVRKFELEHMRTLAEELGNPQRRFTSILIAGTNGKGSTAATLASILRAAGHRVGLYTSPHLVRVNERIRIFSDKEGRSGSEALISDPEFAEVHERVEQAAEKLVAAGKLPHPPSFFEMLTAMAFEYFASAAVEIAVLEVGMGGRLDATNITESCLSVITDVDLDHQQFLGDTITAIAGEKAGIMRRGVPVVMLPQHPDANDALGRYAMEIGAVAVNATEFMPPVTPSAREEDSGVRGQGSGRNKEASLRNRYPIQVSGEEVMVDSPLVGRHQYRNLALAIAAAVEIDRQGYKVRTADIERGIRETEWLGRLQYIPATATRPALLLDVAHNPAGAWALRSALSTHFDGVPITILFGAMRDKAIAEIGDILFPLADRLVLTQADSPRAATPAEIQEAARTATDAVLEADAARAFVRACADTPPQGLVVVTGSIYLVGMVLAKLS
jgi:dihydrofolate synthase / folylpolyglutamate synthase